MSPVPNSVGEAKAGKLTADQWKTFCLVHLIISLIQLWGDFSQDNRYYQLLLNFISLVTAVKIASRRVLTQEYIDLYKVNILDYLKTLLKLFPEISLSPNQHLSGHLSDHMQRFGPAHSWRSFAFERWNYKLQHINTNKKFGK